MQAKLEITDLFSLEDYARQRADFRARVMQHKAHRKVHLGEHVTLLFEDRLTMLYQVQEMLRIERIFEDSEIRSELEAYNPLIPDGTNWKATMMIEYSDPESRREALSQLVGVERQVWVAVEGHPRVTGIADEDLERSDGGKTSAVHFLRFELQPAMIESAQTGAGIRVGIEHARYVAEVMLVESVRESLVADLA